MESEGYNVYSAQLVEGGGLKAPLSFKMTQWSCYCIVLEKVFVIGWRKEILWTRDGEGLTTLDDEGSH